MILDRAESDLLVYVGLDLDLRHNYLCLDVRVFLVQVEPPLKEEGSVNVGNEVG